MSAAIETHYSVNELAQRWKLSANTIRRSLRAMLGAALPGVLQVGNDERRSKRKYITMSIPESVVNDLHNFLTTSVRDRTSLRERRRQELSAGLAPT